MYVRPLYLLTSMVVVLGTLWLFWKGTISPSSHSTPHRTVSQVAQPVPVRPESVASQPAVFAQPASTAATRPAPAIGADHGPPVVEDWWPVADKNDREQMLAARMNLNVAGIKSVRDLKHKYGEIRSTFPVRFADELFYASRKMCEPGKPGARDPEALLCLGLCYEMVGRYDGYVGQFKRVSDIYRAALSAGASGEVRQKLEYRVALYDLFEEEYARRGDQKRGQCRAHASQLLDALASVSLHNMKTFDGQDMAANIQVLRQAAAAPDSIASLQAKMLIADDLFWSNSGLQAKVHMSVLEEVQGSGSQRYEQYLSDDSVPAAQKARLQVGLAEAYYTRRDYKSMYEQSKRALELSAHVDPALEAQAKAQMAKASFELGDLQQARGLVGQLQASSGTNFLSPSRRADIEFIGAPAH